MNRIKGFIARYWKTIILFTVLSSSSFVAGVYANQVIVVGVQPIAGTHVLVPNPGLVVNGVFWKIDPISQNLTGLFLNVTATANHNATYVIIISVSCVNLTSGVVFWCSHGRGIIHLAPNTGGIVPVGLTPQFDPELIEVHDLSFIVTSLPPVPVVPCTTPNCLPGSHP